MSQPIQPGIEETSGGTVLPEALAELSSNVGSDNLANTDQRVPRHGGVKVNQLRLTLMIVILGWTFVYNLLIKEQSPVRAFFQILDTISDDFVGGSFVALLVGCGIVLVFSVTKLYTQVISQVHSFRILEDLFYEEWLRGRYRTFLSRLVRIEEQPQPDTVFPVRISSLILAMCLLYTLSWVYVLLFSEALYFVCWSAGVRLPLRDPQSLLLLPMLAMAIPFSARVMAYIRYPYAQDYADFMPGALFVLLLVGSMGKLYGSSDHVFFLVQVFENREFTQSFLRNGAFLAFIPLFFEAGYWFTDMRRYESLQLNLPEDRESAMPMPMGVLPPEFSSPSEFSKSSEASESQQTFQTPKPSGSSKAVETSEENN